MSLSNTSFLGLIRTTTTNGISVESAVFPQYRLVTNGPTDGSYNETRPVRIVHVRGRVMPPNENNLFSLDGVDLWTAMGKMRACGMRASAGC